jgi:hypothetical protein
MEAHIGDIARVIQLAVAPVFLLTAIAALITTYNNRLGRCVDRRRVLLDRLAPAGGGPAVFAEPGAQQIPLPGQAESTQSELVLLARRIRFIYAAILCAVIAALMICLVVAGAFLGALAAIELSRLVAVLFILAMFSLIASLGLFLREIYLAVIGGTHYAR